MKIRLLVMLLLPVFLSCMRNPSDLPESVGYEGLIAQGWSSFLTGEYVQALEFFHQAMEVDVTRSNAFLGAGITSIHMHSYHEAAIGYLQTAIQLDQGGSAVVRHAYQTVTQDTLWTSIQCVDEDIPADSLQKWLSFTADSGLVWVGNAIRDYLVLNDLSTTLSFRMKPPESSALAACIELYNMQNGAFYSADSISDGFVYFSVPVTATSQGPGSSYFQWVMADQGVLFDSADFQLSGEGGHITLDALAARVSLEDAREEDGDLLNAVACTQGLLWSSPDYRFGEGDQLLEGVFQTQLRHVVACCGSLAFSRGKVTYCWFLCRQAGYGLNLDPDSPTFLIDLLGVLQEMANE